MKRTLFIAAAVVLLIGVTALMAQAARKATHPAKASQSQVATPAAKDAGITPAPQSTAKAGVAGTAKDGKRTAVASKHVKGKHARSRRGSKRQAAQADPSMHR